MSITPRPPVALAHTRAIRPRYRSVLIDAICLSFPAERFASRRALALRMGAWRGERDAVKAPVWIARGALETTHSLMRGQCAANRWRVVLRGD